MSMFVPLCLELHKDTQTQLNDMPQNLLVVLNNSCCFVCGYGVIKRRNMCTTGTKGHSVHQIHLRVCFLTGGANDYTAGIVFIIHFVISE